MTKLQKVTIMLIGLAAIAFAPAVRADVWDQKTVFTFSGPVEIPGRVLDAGTYVFKLANSTANRHIVQVFNQDETQVFATILAIPDYRMHPAEKPIVKFAERSGGAPDAIKGWFFPGRTYGHEFVYPKTEAATLARTFHTPVPAMPAELAPEMVKPDVKLDGPEVAALDHAPLVAEEPDGQEVDLSAAFLMAPTTHAALPVELPTTASEFPLAGVIGLMSLGIAIGLRRAAARAK